MADISGITRAFLKQRMLSKADFITLIDGRENSCDGTTVRAILAQRADEERQRQFGNIIFTRGLIEFTNYCKNNCYYCGIRAGNTYADRYRLSPQEILSCCRQGYSLGFRTFVLQGGEDPFFTDALIADIVRSIKKEFPDCAVTLSVGEHEHDAYQLWHDAGADRYLLREETADNDHYHLMHPASLSPEHRKACLYDLKKIGYQTGAGFMVGSPHQTTENIADDLLFLADLKPQMIGIGPFIHHNQTPFAQEKDGTVELTLFLLSLLRSMFPRVLLPATTALGTLAADGRERGVRCGANVVMPNLSPVQDRKKYSLYNNKICTGEDAAECHNCLAQRFAAIGCTLGVARGDYTE